MALVIDSEMPSNVGLNDLADGSTFTFAFNNVAGTLLIVAIDVTDSDGDMTASGVTYNGTPMTKFNEKLSLGTAKGHLSFWYLASPSTGSQNVIITTAGTATANGQIIAGAISFTGAHATPLANNTSKASTGNTTDNMDVLSTTAGNIAICLMTGGDNVTATSQTRSWLKNVDTNTAANNAVMQRAAAGGTINFSVTINSADAITFLAAEVQAATSGSSSVSPSVSPSVSASPSLSPSPSASLSPSASQSPSSSVSPSPVALMIVERTVFDYVD